ncbi:hypothetical protein HAHE_06450 [Haloferula helveola]|uniref:Alpha/beta hydrolase family protein n=2 Tax=Haloferula helveola TaxID=490095 RepID=A0ABN6GZN8_9BACT|nr:hypothetical protein HAHE_06450 [Haloferula helveola]
MLGLLVAGLLAGCAPTFVSTDPAVPRSEKEALLVLPGLRNSLRGHRAAKRFYPGHGYDVFIPDYVSRDGLDGSVANLEAFISEHRLKEYRKVHAFVHVMGGWSLNKYLGDQPFPNLETVVYNRSPLQEQAPRIYLENMPRIVNLIFGEAVKDMRDTPYPELAKGDRKIAMIIETRATPYVRRHRDQVVYDGARSWTPESFGQEHDDRIYVFLHHDEIYYRLDEFGDELMAFLREGKFTDEAARKPAEGDPFR